MIRNGRPGRVVRDTVRAATLAGMDPVLAPLLVIPLLLQPRGGTDA